MRMQAMLLSVWREACRHSDIARSTAAIVPLLRRDLPLDRLAIRRIVPDRCRVETVVEQAADGRVLEPSPRTEGSPHAMRRLKAWCRRGEVCRRRPGEALRGPMALVAPGEITSNPEAII